MNENSELLREEQTTNAAGEVHTQSPAENHAGEKSEVVANPLENSADLVQAPLPMDTDEGSLQQVEEIPKDKTIPPDDAWMYQLDVVPKQNVPTLDSNGHDLGNEKNEDHLVSVEKDIEVEGREIVIVNTEENNHNHNHNHNHVDSTLSKDDKEDAVFPEHMECSNQSYSFELFLDGDDSGTEYDQSAFMKMLENFHKEKCLEFKPPKFYGEGLNCLKLWRQVTRLGGYDQVTSCKLWRQVGESFRPPKTCTTVSWSFRIFYEKALLEYERHKIRTGELQVPLSSISEPISADHEGNGNQASGSGRARRDAAARAMQGWHSQRLLGNGEVGEPIIKDKHSLPIHKRDKHLKSIGSFKRKKSSSLDRSAKVARTKSIGPNMDVMVVDVGSPADWVKVNVKKTKDCFEVYALVPGLLREEVHVQSDPAGRLVIAGEPEQADNPWGVTSFKKVITLPSRIDPHQTSAVVTLHGQLFVRAPFEQLDL